MNKSNSLDIWIDKYKPKKINDLITNTQAVRSIYAWLVSYNANKKKALAIINEKKNKKVKSVKSVKNNKTDKAKTDKKEEKFKEKSCMLITGGHGVGKSITIEIILKELGYNILRLNTASLKVGKNVNDVIHKLLTSSNIVNVINNNENKKIAVLFDELESITSSAEKACIVALQKYNELNWHCPIIFISDEQHNKLTSDIKKSSFVVKLYSPYDSDMKKILFKIKNEENIKINDGRVINHIITHVQGDIRRLIFTLEDIKNAYGNKLITYDMIQQYTIVSNKKDININLFIATDELLYNYTNIDTCLKLFESEKVLLPLMVHQNYIRGVMNNCESDEDKYDLIQKISDSLSTGDVIENFIYGEQNWNMQEIHGFYTCAAPSYYLSEKITKKKGNAVDFANDLNRTSIKKINKKNITNTNKCFCNMNIYDYIYINKIIRKLIVRNNIKECAQLMKQYNIELEHIETLLKIDKVKYIKLNLNSKQKNEFLFYLNKENI